MTFKLVSVLACFSAFSSFFPAVANIVASPNQAFHLVDYTSHAKYHFPLRNASEGRMRVSCRFQLLGVAGTLLTLTHDVGNVGGNGTFGSITAELNTGAFSLVARSAEHSVTYLLKYGSSVFVFVLFNSFPLRYFLSPVLTSYLASALIRGVTSSKE